MKKLILVALTVLCSAAHAQVPTQPTGSLRTSGVGIDQAGVCWQIGPANTLTPVAFPEAATPTAAPHRKHHHPR